MIGIQAFYANMSAYILYTLPRIVNGKYIDFITIANFVEKTIVLLNKSFGEKGLCWLLRPWLPESWFWSTTNSTIQKEQFRSQVESYQDEEYEW